MQYTYWVEHGSFVSEQDVTRLLERSAVEVGIIQLSLHGGCICSVHYFQFIQFIQLWTCSPQLVHQNLWYVLSCLKQSTYKRSLAAYQKQSMWQQLVLSKEIGHNDHMLDVE